MSNFFCCCPSKSTSISPLKSSHIVPEPQAEEMKQTTFIASKYQDDKDIVSRVKTDMLPDNLRYNYIPKQPKDSVAKEIIILNKQIAFWRQHVKNKSIPKIIEKTNNNLTLVCPKDGLI